MSKIKKNINELSRNKISTFNSKLYLDMELSGENTLSKDDTEDSELYIESSSIKLKDFLSNDLIEELNSPSENNLKVIDPSDSVNLENQQSYMNYDNNMAHLINSVNYNPLFYFMNKGYIISRNNLKTKNNINNCKDKSYRKNNLHNLNPNNKNKKSKKDWICPFCNNLNYSFRVKCNRCGLNKEPSINIKKIDGAREGKYI